MWRFIDTGVGDAVWNMALDEALLNTFEENDLPILRLYRWKPSLSLGRFSDVSKSVDLDKMKQQNLSCVRRMTGGGILVHGQDISYSLILPRESLAANGVKDNYRTLCGFLINLYKKLGLNANYAGEEQLKSKTSDICLAGTEKYDIVINGQKIGGNAQRYTSKTLFQQGSIPIKIDKPLFEPVFLEDSGLKNAVTLEQLESLVTYRQLTQLIIEAFCKTFDINIVSHSLSLTEEQKVEELITQKYGKESWNLYGK
ncbi:MAG: lipoate--protein ligase family protein [Arcobacteraceae bacterium]|nr:lipoate--protein ligase family protein [Arcobacteraceae bacterium]